MSQSGELLSPKAKASPFFDNNYAGEKAMNEKIYLYEGLTLEELTADKWLREIVRRGEIDGREYRIYTNGFFPTAYIEATPKEIHEYRDSGGIVHGGFTFDGELENSDKRWLGWDYAHAGDYFQFYNRLGFPMELHKWTVDEIMWDVESAAKALADAKLEGAEE